MSLKKIVLVISGILITYVSGLWAGDTASFVDLGFSPDGGTYMFGQYGVQSSSLKPWAELFTVDVRSNSFVPNGRISHTRNTPIKAGQDGSGTFYRLITGNSGLASRYGIDFENQGQPLYISLDKNPSGYGETINFRDFVFGKTYRADLVSSIEGGGQSVRSSFYIKLECRLDSGQVRNYTVGSPRAVRSQVEAYNIKRVLVNTQGDSLIFVIEMKCFGEDGHDIRYMVEALRL